MKQAFLREELILNQNQKLEGFDQLIEAFLTVENAEECRNFLLDICTMTELQSMAQRLEVARQLENHQIYASIVESTGASTATISRVNRALHYGDNGYQVILERLKKDE